MVDTQAPNADKLLAECKGDLQGVGYPFLAVLDEPGAARGLIPGRGHRLLARGLAARSRRPDEAARKVTDPGPGS